MRARTAIPSAPTVPRCVMCHGSSFEHRRGVLETRGLTFLGLSWADRGKTGSIWRGRGYIHAFADVA